MCLDLSGSEFGLLVGSRENGNETSDREKEKRNKREEFLADY
jgi:hypothetical protein